MINKCREVKYSDDGCSYYQCLSCKEQWESRSSPEYGWKFCPMCGVQWSGFLKTRSVNTPKWRWLLIEQYYACMQADVDHNRIHRLQEHIENNYYSVENNRSVWTIQYKKHSHWQCDRAFHCTTSSVHKKVYEQMLYLKKEREKEREVGIKNLQELYSSYPDKDYVNELCEEQHPELQWRIRIMNAQDLQDEYRVRPYNI